MSDFSSRGYCRKHKQVVCPDDGGCPLCADENYCGVCGAEFDPEGYCSCDGGKHDEGGPDEDEGAEEPEEMEEVALTDGPEDKEEQEIDTETDAAME